MITMNISNKDINGEMIKMLERDNHKLRESGMNLARAAINVIDEYDGIHRLSRAVADWFIAISNQGDRGEN